MGTTGRGTLIERFRCNICGKSILVARSRSGRYYVYKGQFGKEG